MRARQGREPNDDRVETETDAGPALTVVIPTKDRPAMVPEAVRSVLEQVEDVEVIVVDDGSTLENARAISASCSDPRVRVLRNEEARGAPHGRNQGLADARGRYWATLDDDDRWLPGKWAAQHAVLQDHGFPSDLVVVAGIRSSEGERSNEVVPLVRAPERFERLTPLFRRVRIGAFLNTYVVPTSLMRDAGGYDERLVWGEHTDMLIRLAQVGRFAGTDRISVHVDRGHELAGTRVGRNWAKKVEGIRLLLDKHEAAFAREPQLRALYLHALGISQLRVGDRWGAARTFWRVVLIGPGVTRRLRVLAQLVTTVIGGPRLWRWVTQARGVRVDAVA
ncbi:MAG: glycosyltransferase [Actinobacteria bacterium]|nr:glycosyltransferase [Actinomycetota bacterium]